MKDPYGSPESQEQLRLERIENRKRLAAIHPANRFRLMFGLPPIPESKPTRQDERRGK